MLFKYSEKVELLRVTACSKRPVSLWRAKSICFLSKNKKNQNKEEKIIVFCWLSTSLVKGFSFSFMEEKILYFFFTTPYLENSRKKEKKSRKCLSLSFYLVFRHSHIFKDWKKHINRKKYFFKSKKCCFRFLDLMNNLQRLKKSAVFLKKEGIVEKRP